MGPLPPYYTKHSYCTVLSILSLLYYQSYYPYCHYCTLIYTHLYWSHSGWLLLLMILPLLMVGGMFPGTPLELRKAFVPLQVRMMSPPLHFSEFLWSCYTSKGSISLKLQFQEEEF